MQITETLARLVAEALESVRQLIHRERFAQAEKELAAFSLNFPNSDLETERRDMEDRFEGQRAAAMERFLVRNWHLRAIALVKRRSLDRNANVEEILGWIEAEVAEWITERIAARDAAEAAAVKPNHA